MNELAYETPFLKSVKPERRADHHLMMTRRAMEAESALRRIMNMDRRGALKTARSIALQQCSKAEAHIREYEDLWRDS